MDFKVDGTIKLDVNIAITITVTIILLFQNQAVQQTNSVVNDVKNDVQYTKKTVQDVQNNTKQNDIKLRKSIDKLNLLGNDTKISQLNDAQLIKLAKQILKEVD